MTNYYPEKPLLPYKKTMVPMQEVIDNLRVKNIDPELKRIAYIMFRNESSNGKSGINNNYCGFQADSGRWSDIFDKFIAGVVEKVENGTGKTRLFLAFFGVDSCLNMLLDRIYVRGIFIGGTTSKIWKMKITNVNDLARAYKKEWVAGSVNAEPSSDEIGNFKSIYKQAEKLFV